ncbi:hypothetical protein J1780_04680 [Rahnella aceris]|uniref:hypothetical protein n=1 Tax=Rahnella sp. (strain Y9602) TaxID=2703885 RepID=UPI001C263064|nr:hypothetical protein [Rahnella aceris]MBU9839249.1 hypothetical protein [Rahnella aceris]
MRKRGKGGQSGLAGLLSGMLCLASPVQAGEMSMSDFLSAVGDVEVPAQVAAPERAVQPLPRIPSRPMVGEGPRPEGSPSGDRLRAENRQLQAALDRLQAQNITLRRELTARNKKAAAGQETEGTAQRDLLAQQSARQAALEQVQAKLTAAERQVRQLAAENHDLSVKADQNGLMLTPEQQKQRADLKDKMVYLSTERDTLQQQKAALGEVNDGLQSQLKTLTEERDDLRKLAGELKVQVLSLTGLTDSLQTGQVTQKAAVAQVAVLTGERDALKKQVSDAQVQQASLQDALKTAQTQAGNDTLQVKTLSKERDGLKQQLIVLKNAAQANEQTASASQTQIQALMTERDQMQQQVAALTAKAFSAAPDSGAAEKAQQALKDLTGKVATLTGQVTDLTAQRDSLQAKVAQGEPVPEAVSSVPAAPVLDTEAGKQTYASGVMLAGNLKRTLALQKDLGVETEPGLLLAGLADAVNGTVRLDERGVSEHYQALVKRLSDLEEGKYRDGEKQLEKLTAGGHLLKRNRTMFFLQGSKGAGVVRSGDKVRFDLTESVVKGKTLRNNKGVSATVNDQLPYVVSQALTLAGRGGNITVYSLASDVYPPEQIPEGLFAYSVLKYTFRVADK